MRQLDSDTNKAVDMDMDNYNSEEFDEEIKQSQVEEVKQGKAEADGTTVGRGGRRRVPVAQPI